MYGSRSCVGIGGIECDGSIDIDCLVENLDVNNVGDAVCEGFFCVDRVINADDGDVLNNEVILPLTARDKKMIAAAMMMEVDEI